MSKTELGSLYWAEKAKQDEMVAALLALDIHAPDFDPALLDKAVVELNIQRGRVDMAFDLYFDAH